MTTNKQYAVQPNLAPKPVTIVFHRKSSDAKGWGLPLTITGPAADTVRQLMDRSGWGVHVSVIDLDTLPELDRQGFQYEAYADADRGTGEERCWLRVDQSVLLARILKLAVVQS